MSLSILIDIANVIYFCGSLSQFRSTFINRKNNIKPISYLMLMGYLIGAIMFAIANYSFGATIGSIFNWVSSFIYGLQIYWKIKYRRI